MRSIRAAALVASTILAGCAESPPVPDEPPAEPVQQLPSSLDVALADRTPDATYLLPIDPVGPVAGFQLPVDAERAAPMFEGSSFTYYHIAFELVFDEAPEGAIVMFFAGGRLLAVYPMEPLQATTWLTAALPTDISAPADFGPHVVALPADSARQEIGIVVGARGLQSPAALLVHFAHGPEQAEGPVQGPAQVMTPHGSGADYEVHQLTEFASGLVGPVGLLGYVMQIGQPTVEERSDAFLLPHGGARDATLEATCALGGWGYAVTAYLAGEGGGLWSHEVSAGEASAEDDGVMLWGDGYGFLAGALALGLPVGFAEGDGDGPATGRVDVQLVETGQIHLAIVTSLCLDQPVHHLLGEPARAQAAVVDGLVRLEADGIQLAGTKLACSCGWGARAMDPAA